MDNQLYIPDLNPIRFYEEDPDEYPQYLSRHFDVYRFADQHLPWQQRTLYFQKWQTSDVIYLQFTSNFSPIQIDLMDKYQISRLPLTAIPVRENKWLPGYFIYQVTISLAGVQPGCYYLRLSAGSPAIATMFSEPLIIAVKHKNTLLLEYKNSRYHGDVIFETGIRFGFRVEGTIGKMTPGRNSTIYTDQKENPSTLRARKYRSFNVTYGGSRGLPDWVVDLIEGVWTCNSVFIDGKEFAASEDTKLEYTEIKNYRMRGITMEVREGVNRGSKIIGGTVNQEMRMIVVHNIDSKMFGDLSSQAASNIIPITDIE